MDFDKFAIAIGYLTIGIWVIMLILMIIIFIFGSNISAQKESFSYARRMLHEGIPGPVWFYYW